MSLEATLQQPFSLIVPSLDLPEDLLLLSSGEISKKDQKTADLSRKYLPVPRVLEKDNRGIFSSLVKLPYLLHKENYLLLNSSPYYPEYYQGERIELLCPNASSLRLRLEKKLKPYIKKGFTLKTKSSAFGCEILLKFKGANDLRFVLIDDITAFSKGRLDSNFQREALKDKKSISKNGFMTYLLPDSLLSDFNRAYPSRVFKKEKPSLELMLIWSHGLKYQRRIVSIIDNYEGFNVLSVHKKAYKSLEQLVELIYAREKVRPSHIRSKIKHLQKLSPRLSIVVFENFKREEARYGEGVLQVTQCQRVKKLKDLIRNQFNPRDDKGMRTESHVIHAADNSSESKAILEYFKIALPSISN